MSAVLGPSTVCQPQQVAIVVVRAATGQVGQQPARVLPAAVVGQDHQCLDALSDQGNRHRGRRQPQHGRVRRRLRVLRGGMQRLVDLLAGTDAGDLDLDVHTRALSGQADQSLGRRDSGTGDSGLSGRLYSMIAQEMADTGNRGKVVWILASSRPDLIEVDLKRPGRVDVKVPLLPTTTQTESAGLIGFGLPNR